MKSRRGRQICGSRTSANRAPALYPSPSMHRLPALLLAASLLCRAAAYAAAEPAAAPPVSRDDAVRMQIFLDSKNFGPGKIDGRFGGFTRLSWVEYQKALGQIPPSETFDPHAPELTSISPVYLSYTITAADVEDIGPMPKEVPQQAKLKRLPYASLLELIGERFHSSVKFLRELNAGKNMDTLKEGSVVTVPNVATPFNVSDVENQRQAEIDARKFLAEARKRQANANASPAPAPLGAPPKPLPYIDVKRRWVHVSVKDSYLQLHEGDKIIASFPITPGSTAIPTPVGNWFIEDKTLMPEFRWDKSVLMTGKRSDVFFQLPPGPNNPVGITWIALNKPGIGMHGTAEPDTIGRAASHGCIRLANWDAIKLYGMVDRNMRVTIE